MKKNRVPVRFTGQHFTIDTPLIIDAIHLSEIEKEDIVLDIGAGLGFITDHLAKYSNYIIAIENDARLVAELNRKFKLNKTVKIFHADVREFQFPKKSFKTVSNIPYGITSDILKSLMFTHLEYFDQGCLIIQLDPAQKLIRKKIFNPYVIFYHTFYRLELMYEISGSSFLPPPTVKSALLKINRHQESSVPIEMKKKYLDFLHFIMRYPDLTVRTSLKKIFRKLQVREVADKYGVKLDKPVSDMSISQFAGCFNEMLRAVPEKFYPSR